MDTEVKEEKVITAAGVLDQSKLQGTWKLSYTLSNTLKADAFGNYHLGSYTDPLTGKTVYRREPNGKMMLGYNITSVTSFISVGPGNPQANLDIVWLLNHPSVGVEGFVLNDKVKSSKNSNPRMMLVNLDNQADKKIDEQEVIDRLISDLSNNKIASIKKLRFINAALNKPFFDARYMNNPAAEGKKLRAQVKDHVRGNYENAKIVMDILKDMDSAQKIYEVKRALQHGIIYATNGSMKDREHNIVLGHDINRVVLYITDNTDYYVSLQERIKLADQKEKEKNS